MGDFKKLTTLSIGNCPKLIELPDSIVKLYALENFSLNNLEALNKLPKSLFELPSLKTLSFGNLSSLKKFPKGISKLSLEKININRCVGLPDFNSYRKEPNEIKKYMPGFVIKILKYLWRR